MHELVKKSVKKGLSGALVLAFALTSIGVATAGESTQSTGSADSTEQTHKALRPRKRLRQAIMQRFKNKKHKQSASPDKPASSQ